MRRGRPWVTIWRPARVTLRSLCWRKIILASVAGKDRLKGGRHMAATTAGATLKRSEREFKRIRKAARSAKKRVRALKQQLKSARKSAKQARKQLRKAAAAHERARRGLKQTPARVSRAVTARPRQTAKRKTGSRAHKPVKRATNPKPTPPMAA